MAANENPCVEKKSAVSKNCKILIIGAGVAGLAAANHLLSNNIKDFLIVEARNRIGGRVVAINIGKFIDFP